MPRILLFIILNTLCWLAYAQSSQNHGWDLVEEDDGIEVFTRTNDSSLIKEIRITVTVSSTVAIVSDLLGEVPLYTQWVYKCDSSKLLKRVNEHDFYYYVRTDFPFPFSDRDLVVHSKQWIEDATGAYFSHSYAHSGIVRKNADIIRITDFESSWHIKPVHGGLLFIDYQAKSSPGGEIPLWLVNLAITKGPLETMKGFLKSLEERTNPRN